MEILLMICCLILVGICATPILSAAVEYDPLQEDYPIIYSAGDDPEIDKNEILEDIHNCDDQVSLNWAFLRIQIYTGDYPGQKKFIAELNDSYKTKERLINSNIE